MASGSLWNYYRNEIDDADENALDNKACKYKKTRGKTPIGPLHPGNPKDASQLLQPPVSNVNAEVTILLKYLYNFWRSHDLPLIYCELEIDLS